MHNMKSYLDILFKLSAQPQAKHERGEKDSFLLPIKWILANNNSSGRGLERSNAQENEENEQYKRRSRAQVAIALRWSVNQLMICLCKGNKTLTAGFLLIKWIPFDLGQQRVVLEPNLMKFLGQIHKIGYQILPSMLLIISAISRY